MLNPSRASGLSWPIYLLIIWAGLAIMAVGIFGGLWLIQHLQALRCPAGTFLAGSGYGATVVQVLSLFMVTVGAILIGATWLVQDLSPRGRRGVTRVSLILMSLMLLLCVTASFSRYCLQPRGILIQAKPWTDAKQYVWNDVAAIETGCVRGKHGDWNGLFMLVMRDNVSVNIDVSPDSFLPAYPKMVRALDGVAFAFKPDRVDPRCGLPYVNMLTRRP